MKIAFELSGEHTTLPRAEVIACLESLNIGFSEVAFMDQLLVVDVQELPPIAKRLALTHHILDVVFIAPVFAALGLLAGTVMALGLSVGESLLGKRARLGRTLGGTLLGGLGFAAVLSLFAIVDPIGLPGDVVKIVGGGLFGMTIGLGITAPAAISPKRAVGLGGGAVGGALGIVVWGAMGMKPFQAGSVPAPVLLVSGGLVGLIMAFSIVWAEARWPGGKKKRKDKEK